MKHRREGAEQLRNKEKRSVRIPKIVSYGMLADLFYGLFLGKLTADSCMDSGSEIRMAQTADPLFGSAADKYTLPDVLV